MDFDNSGFADRLKNIRTKSGLTQEGLSAMTGINGVTISHYEKGDYVPGSSNLLKLCSALGCDPNWLMGWSDPARGE